MQIRDVLLPVQHKILLPFRQRTVHKFAVKISNALLEIGLLNGCRGDHTIFDHFPQAVSHRPTCGPAPERDPCLYLAMSKLTTVHATLSLHMLFGLQSGLQLCVCAHPIKRMCVCPPHKAYVCVCPPHKAYVCVSTP